MMRETVKGSYNARQSAILIFFQRKNSVYTCCAVITHIFTADLDKTWPLKMSDIQCYTVSGIWTLFLSIINPLKWNVSLSGAIEGLLYEHTQSAISFLSWSV